MWQKIILLISALFCYALIAQSQPPYLPDLLEDKEINSFGESPLFLHSDKSIYLPGEYIWFSAYVFKKIEADTSIHSVFVSLIHRFKKQVYLSGRYALSNTGLAAGSLFIPDSLPDGDYVLIAYTDDRLINQNIPIFHKDIFIRSTREHPYAMMPFESHAAVSNEMLQQKYLVTSPQIDGIKGTKVSYMLYKDSFLIQEGTTEVNNTGEINVNAPLKVISLSQKINLVMNVLKDTINETKIFPLSLSKAANNKIGELAVQENATRDSLLIRVRSSLAGQQHSISIFNSAGLLYKGIFSVNNSNALIRLPVDSLSKSHLIIQLFNDRDQLLDEKEYDLSNDRVLVSIEPDKPYISPRSRVMLKIKCTDIDGRPVQGVFSVSCALSKRCLQEEKNIKFYFYNSYDDVSKNEKTKKKTRLLEGTVYYYDKKPPKPVGLVILNGLYVNVIETDASGRFFLPSKMMLAAADRRLVISIASGSPDGYVIELKEADKFLNARLARTYYPMEKNPDSVLAQEVITEQERRQFKNMLKEVVVRPPNDREIVSPEDAPCGAWVCSCDHWKCLGCRPLLVPIKGRSYLDLSSPKKKFVTFNGCAEDGSQTFLKRVQAICLPKEFSPFNAENEDLDLSSTLYWNPMVRLDENGEAMIECRSNDLTGKFSVNIEGMTEAGPFTANTTFFVK